ncbi:MAG: ABC transporter ATP-binding protein [Ilumatobacter sp.]|uniref:ABC transporter ATP-binding protein n=1 Tax=Ilumatobacter sp. TaxID=1967498 RepID=UPI0026177B28|nr:ABC transporter ATP-binding protein [Ilumatobacter sp.]MDJ0769076.1 ABC transporter ATP-binding protein [Ilumatobacter sp.]
MAVVEVRDLVKRYGELAAVDGVSFEIHEGEVYGLLGHNGAGKSTTVEILEGHRERSAGAVTVLGVDPAAGGRELRDRIGIVLQTSGVETELTVVEAIGLYGSAYRRRRPTDELLDLVGLEDKAGARIGTLSGGQKRRLDLALGIVGYPELVFLDEPTTGFDPAARRKSWDMIQGLCSLGTTVLLTTHYLDEAERLADRVGVLTDGRLVAEGTPAELIGRIADTVVSFSAGDDLSGLRELLPPDAIVNGSAVEFATSTPTADVHAVTNWAIDRGVELHGLSVTRPSLEDVFLGLARDEVEPSTARDGAA